MAAKEMLTQGPGPAIGMRQLRTFQFLEAYVCLSPKPEPLEDEEKGEDKDLYFSAHQNCLCILLLSVEPTARKHVSFALKCSSTRISFGSSGTERKSLPAMRVPT